MAALRVGDPFDEVLGAWLAKEAVRSVYLEDDPDAAAVLLDNAIAACARRRRARDPHPGPHPARGGERRS